MPLYTATLIATAGGQDFRNVLGVQHNLANAENYIGATIRTAWQTRILPHVHQDYVFQGVDVVQENVDTAGAFTPRTGTGMGVQNGERAPLWVCASVRLQTGVRGRQGQGRTGIGPLAETYVAGDGLAATQSGPFAAAVTGFFQDIQTAMSPENGGLAVLSRYKGVDAAGKPIKRPAVIGTLVTSVSVNPFLGSRLTRHPGR
jgi:hypothetical protein